MLAAEMYNRSVARTRQIPANRAFGQCAEFEIIKGGT